MEEGTKLSSSSNSPKSCDAHLDDVLNSIVSSDYRLSSDDFETIPVDEKALILLRIAKSSEASNEIRSLSIDRLAILLMKVMQLLCSNKLSPFFPELEEWIETLPKNEINNELRCKLTKLLAKAILSSIELSSGVLTYKFITKFMQGCENNECTALKEIALSLFLSVPNVFGENGLSDLCMVMEKSLEDGNATVRFAAIRIFVDVFNEDNLGYLSHLIPSVIQACEDFMGNFDEIPTSLNPIANLSILAGKCAESLLPYLEDIIHLCLMSDNVCDETHSFAMKILREHLYDMIHDEYFTVMAMSIKVIRSTNGEDGIPLSDANCARRLRAIHLCRLFTDYDYFDSLTATNMTPSEIEIAMECCRELLKAAYLERDHEMSNKILTIIYHIDEYNPIFNQTDFDRSFPEFLRHTQDESQSDHNLMITLKLIRNANIVNPSTDLLSLFERSLTHSKKKIRWEALSVFAVHCNRVKNREILERLGSLIPIIIELGDSSETKEGARECIVMVKFDSHDLFNNHTPEVVQFLCNLVDESLNWRVNGIQSIKFICKVPRLVEKIPPHLLPSIVSSFLLVMSNLDDIIESWFLLDNPDSMGRMKHENDKIKIVDELSEMASLLKEKQFTMVLLNQTFSLLEHDDWKKRHAGVMGLSSLAHQLNEEIGLNVINRIILLLDDPHCRVRAATCAALRRIFICAPFLLSQCHAYIIPALLTTLEDGRCSRVAAAAAAALTRFSIECPESSFSIHLKSIMETTIGVVKRTYDNFLTQGKTRTLAQIISLISSMKGSSGQFFIQYYSNLIDLLKAILASSIHCEVLDSAAIECVSHIGIAVEATIFSADSLEIMTILTARFDSLLISTVTAMPKHFVRLASAMGDSFFQFLPSLMQPITDSIRVRTLKERYDDAERRRARTACDISTKLASSLGVSFFPFVDEFFLLALAWFHKNRNEPAWSLIIVPALLSCIKGDTEWTRKLWIDYWRAVKERIPVWGPSWGRTRKIDASLIWSIEGCIKNGLMLDDDGRREIRDVILPLNEEEKSDTQIIESMSSLLKYI